MAAESNGGRPEVRNPLLGGGERLREDAERPGGGRQSPPPYTLEQMYARLSPQARQLRDAVGEMHEELRARHVVIEATLLPNYLASHHFPDRLLHAAALYPVGAREARGVRKTRVAERPNELTKTLLLAGEPERVQEFASMILERPRTEDDPIWAGLREFGELALPSVEHVVRGMPVDPGAGELITWEAVLNPIGRTPAEQREWGEEAFERWVRLVTSLQGEVDVPYRRRVGPLTFVPVALTAESVRAAAGFNLLRAIRPMPQIRPVPSTILRVASRPAPSPPPPGTPPLSNERIAVFDGGIDAGALPIRDYAREIDLTPEVRSPEGVNHGIMITTAALFGYVEPGAPLGRPVGYVDHYRVLPAPRGGDFDDELYWILDRITETLRAGKYTLVHLSLGPDCAVEDEYEPHRWTAELDALAAELGLTLVVAAGNNGALDTDLGLDRVQPPADMANGIAVGACNSREEPLRLQRAPYSARGPGRAGQRVSPTGVQFGGHMPASPFVGVGAGGRLVEAEGTSFAAPLVTHGLAELSAALGREHAAPHTLRAFAAHFAEGRRRGHRPREFGHGRLRETYGDVWDCPSNQATVVYEDELARGEVAAMYLPVPSPKILPDVPLAVEWTICYTSAIDPTDAVDYTRSGLEVTLRPNFNLRSLLDGKTGDPIATVDIEHQQDLIAKIAAGRAVRWGETPKSHSNWRTTRDEGRQRGAGKWETLIRGRMRFRASELVRPRIDLNHLARERGTLLGKQQVPPLPVTMVVTVEAPPEIPLYDLVKLHFDVLTPITQQVATPVLARV